MKIVFMGTPDFAVPSLDMLVKENYDVAAVVTQPDKPKGRGNKLTPSPVKEYSLKAGLMVLQPEKIKSAEFIEELRSIAPDLIITAAYGKILPKIVLDLPQYGCINVHGSLLPKYRGAAPVHWAIINGDKVSGITTMYMDAGIDTGDILHKKEIPIPDDMTAGELYDRLAELGAVTLKETLEMLKVGTMRRQKQQENQATYVKTVDKDLGCIDWSKPAKDVHNLVRGTNPWPGGYTYYKGEKMKIWKTVVGSDCSDVPPGTIAQVSKEGIEVACGKGTVVIKEVQFNNCRRMTTGEYLCGHHIEKGEILLPYRDQI